MIGISDFSRAYLRNRTTYFMQGSHDTCEIRRPGSNKTVYDPITRKVVRLGGELVYSGPCRLWEVSGGRNVWVQDREVTLSATRLSIPFDATTPDHGDIVLITGSEDTELVGRSLKVDTVVRGGGLRGSRTMSVQFTDEREEEL